MKARPILLMAYCTADDVAALARVWTDNAEFIDPDYGVEGTNPTLSAVETWIDNVSAQMDLALGQHWFYAPVPQTANAYPAISQFVAKVVADLVAEVKGQGSFVTDAYTVRGASPQSTILREMKAWVEDNADGLSAQGLTQVQTPAKKNSVRMSSLWNGD